MRIIVHVRITHWVSCWKKKKCLHIGKRNVLFKGWWGPRGATSVKQRVENLILPPKFPWTRLSFVCMRNLWVLIPRVNSAYTRTFDNFGINIRGKYVYFIIGKISQKNTWIKTLEEQRKQKTKKKSDKKKKKMREKWN